MESPSWNQDILLISKDLELKKKLSDSFGDETSLTIEQEPEKIKKLILQKNFQVMIVDAKNFKTDEGLDPKNYLEICDRSSHKDSGIVIIVLTNKALLQNQIMAELSGVTATLDRRDFSMAQVHFIIRVFRKRTFRAIVWNDIPIGYKPPVELYYYMPLNKRYAVAMVPEKPFNDNLRKKLQQQHCYQLFAQGKDILTVLEDLKIKNTNDDLISPRIRNFRRKYKNYLAQFFNLTMEGNLSYGKMLFDRGAEIVSDIQSTIERFANPVDCLKQLPFERYSDLAHPLNIAIYLLVFGNHLKINETETLAHIALFHNIGTSDIPQAIFLKKPQDRNHEENLTYQKHVEHSLAHMKRVRLPLEDWCDDVVHQHHECYDGTGYPNGLIGKRIHPLSQLLSIAGAFDHHRSLSNDSTRQSLYSAWTSFKNTKYFEDTKTKKPFDPEWLLKIDTLILNN